MSDRQKITWRIGWDGKAHAIHGCDPHASAWVPLCGGWIAGPVRQKEPKCPTCLRKIKR